MVGPVPHVSLFSDFDLCPEIFSDMQILKLHYLRIRNSKIKLKFSRIVYCGKWGRCEILGRSLWGNSLRILLDQSERAASGTFWLTLARPLFATPGAPVAGQCGHFRLSKLILRGPEVIATNAFFQKQRATFSDRHNYSKHELYLTHWLQRG